MKRFENKVALVTGAGKNIGKEVALAFVREGAKVIVCDYNEENTLKTVQEIRDMGGEAFPMVCDVRDRAAIGELTAQAVQELGPVDILVNNAGGSAMLLNKLTHFVDAEPETIDFVLDVNIKGSMNCIQAVLRSMIERKSGKIISISSIAAICGLVKRVDYAAAKAALIGMTRSLAMEVGEYNICVNCVSPGAIERNGREMPHMTFLGEDGRSGKPKDIADTVLFLASQDFITGQNFVVDGGRTLGPGAR